MCRASSARRGTCADSRPVATAWGLRCTRSCGSRPTSCPCAMTWSPFWSRGLGGAWMSDEFGRWVATRRPLDWVLDMVQYTAMSTSARAEVVSSIETEDPEVRERQRHLVELLLAKQPDLKRALKDEGRDEGRLAEARSAVRRVLARRGLPLSPEDDARIEACTVLATLERWLGEAVVAPSAAEALRSS